jgi:hypothetical protein
MSTLLIVLSFLPPPSPRGGAICFVVLLDPFDVVPHNTVFKPELAHLGILRARFGYAFEQVVRLTHQPLYPLLVGLARYVDHSFTSLKNIPARGGGANGEPMCGFYLKKKGRKIPPAGVPPAEGKRRYHV